MLPPRPSTCWLAPSLAVAAFSLLATGTLGCAREEVVERPAQTVRRTRIERIVIATGTVEPATEVEIRPRIAGIVEKIHVEEGDLVEPGQPLVEIERELLASQVREAEANLQAADVELHFFSPITKERGDSAIQQVRTLIAIREGYDPAIETAMWSFNIQEPLNLIRSVFFGIRIFMFGAGLVTLFVGAVGVMNIMLVVVGERTQEIGVRKAIGARGRDIFIQFLAEATLVATASGLLGASVGIGFVRIVAAVIPEGSAYQSPPIFDPLIVSVLSLSLVGFGIVSGAMPDLLASRIPPAEALRAP